MQTIGVTERPQVALADAGYWHQVQMQNIARPRHSGARAAGDGDARGGHRGVL